MSEPALFTSWDSPDAVTAYRADWINLLPPLVVAAPYPWRATSPSPIHRRGRFKPNARRQAGRKTMPKGGPK